MSESKTLKSWVEENDLGITIDPIELSDATDKLNKLFDDNNNTYDSSGVASRSEIFFSKEKYINNISDVLRTIG